MWENVNFGGEHLRVWRSSCKARQGGRELQVDGVEVGQGLHQTHSLCKYWILHNSRYYPYFQQALSHEPSDMAEKKTKGCSLLMIIQEMFDCVNVGTQKHWQKVGWTTQHPFPRREQNCSDTCPATLFKNMLSPFPKPVQHNFQASHMLSCGWCVCVCATSSTWQKKHTMSPWTGGLSGVRLLCHYSAKGGNFRR